jgi:signal transduction histidine kinase/ActR/RegA family two-component response regulator
MITPMFIAGFIYSYTPSYLKRWQLLMSVYVILSGAGHLAMMWIAKTPEIHVYYAGIITVLFFGYMFIRLRFIPATVSAWLVVFLYLGFSFFGMETPRLILISHSAFLVTINILGMVISYFFEIDARRNFFLSHLLDQEQAKVKTTNLELERRVAERTAALTTSNRKLRFEIEAHQRAEKDKSLLEQQLRQAQKMEAIGTLAGGIAHDFNNILSAIIGFTELTMEDLDQKSPYAENLREVLVASGRAKDLIRQILTFSRLGEQELNPISLSAIVKETVKLMRASLPSTIEIRQDIASHAVVMADATQIHQLVMNLCTNAGHAMRNGGGTLNVRLSEVELDANQCRHYRKLIPGPYLKLTVADTGHGIPPEILERIFEPFFTTKQQGEGTGLGLSVVHGIVNGHGGEISVSSKPNEGTTFEILFPCDKQQKEEMDQEISEIKGGTETILLIDDEPALVQVGRKLLEKLGYTVESRFSSLDALEAFQHHPHRFDLVITDLTMPQMTGDKLASQLIGIRPDIPIILCTGFSAMLSPEQAKACGIQAIITKPIIKRHLADTVRKILDPIALHRQESPGHAIPAAEPLAN